MVAVVMIAELPTCFLLVLGVQLGNQFLIPCQECLIKCVVLA
jgi:hypothetical protein